MTKEQAYKILELRQEASKEEIKKKYENFMRLVKFDNTYDEKKLTEAFDVLMDYSFGEIKNEKDIYKKGINKKKIENFFYYYKRHLIYGFIALICFSTIFISLFSRQPKPDAGVLFTGNTYVSDPVSVEKYFQDTYGYDFIRVLSISMSISPDGGVNSANMFKFAGILQGGEADIIVTDNRTLNFLASDGALEDLKQYFELFGIKEDDKRIIWLEDFDKGIIAAAIKVDSFNTFREQMSGATLTYIAMPDYTKNAENALDIISQIIKSD